MKDPYLGPQPTRGSTREAAAALGKAVEEFLVVVVDALTPPPPPPEPPAVLQDRLLRPERAGELFGVSRQYFYDHEEKLPYVVRLSNGILRVSEKGMAEWITERRLSGNEIPDKRSRSVTN